MVYIAGIIGFVLGFGAGLALLSVLLKNRSNREITSDSGIKWTYGLLVWIIASVGAYIGVTVYGTYF